MNLSQVEVDLQSEPQPQEPKLRAEEARLVRIIEALRAVTGSKEWSTLKTEVFDNLVNVLEKELRAEAERPIPDTNKLNRISGKLEWSRRYANLNKFEEEKRTELKNLRLNLNGKPE